MRCRARGSGRRQRSVLSVFFRARTARPARRSVVCVLVARRASSPPSMSRTALITGASGFVGGHLAERLAGQGWRVRALVRASSNADRLKRLGAELHTGALDDVDAITAAAAGADTVFHLAALTTAPDEATFRRANAEGTRNVALALTRAGTRPRRLVYLSSYAACGPAVGGCARRLDETPAPLTAYGRSKLEGEAAAREVLDPSGVELVVLRAPAVYGPGDRAFLPVFRMAKFAVAPVPTGPRRRVHVIYVHDL